MKDWKDIWPDFVSKTGRLIGTAPQEVKDAIYAYRLSQLDVPITCLEPYAGVYQELKHECSCGNNFYISPKEAFNGRRCFSCCEVTGYT